MGDGAAELTAVEFDRASGETRVHRTWGPLVVVKGTRSARVPSPLPTGSEARIVDESRVVTGEAAVLTIRLGSGDLLQVAGSGLAVRAA